MRTHSKISNNNIPVKYSVYIYRFFSLNDTSKIRKRKVCGLYK